MILMLVATLGGCGQKGPLYRDNPDAVVTPDAPVRPNQTPTQDQEPNGSL
ncbi:MAG TPA: hypothetical protein ENI00_11885 [Marinobacter antarcticus]|uniref:Lipoprotein-attachment site-containing protein n=1 Tax=Marinobacter antarcticus TaxID=564117 RepID=A0A831VZY7_9GAMM|nr:hypothetical protein [Marinobacter antarcticus]